MTTTDAEAIARIIEAEIEHDIKGNIAWANGKRAAAAILSYLASRREAQEPIIGGTALCGHGRMASTCLQCTAPPAPAGEIERLVKPIIDRLEWNGRLQQWVVRPDLPAGTIKAARAALNGGRADG